MAAIVPIDAYQRWRRLAKERVFLMLEEVWQRNEGASDEVLENEVKQALDTLRQDRLASNGA